MFLVVDNPRVFSALLGAASNIDTDIASSNLSLRNRSRKVILYVFEKKCWKGRIFKKDMPFPMNYLQKFKYALYYYIALKNMEHSLNSINFLIISDQTHQKIPDNYSSKAFLVT